MTRPLRILHIEDNDADRHLALRALAPINAAVVHADSLAAAEHDLKNQSFDCVLLDWQLPDGAAHDLLRSVRRTLPRLPVVVLTGSQDERLAQQVLQHGAQDYLVKENLGQNDLVRSVRYAIERHRALALTAQLDHAQRLASVGLLAAGVAHELNNPALVLMANLSIMKEQLESQVFDLSAFAALVDQCTLALERVSSLTRQLGRFSRRDQGSAERVDPNTLIEEALTLARPSARHRAQVVLDLQPSPPIVVNRNAIAGVVVNLLVNAQQAIDSVAADAHCIRVGVRPVDHGVSIRVEDSGPGIAADDVDRLFEPFVTRTPSGTGLGLAISKEIVTAHRGHIEVEPSSLGGAAFTVWLPHETGLWAETAPADPKPAPEVDDVDVLIIDDEEAIRTGLARMLRRHRVKLADSCPAALEMLADGYRPAVILCDLVMPVMSGVEFLDDIVKRYPDLVSRIVFMTGGAPTPNAQHFLENTSVEVLRKPFTPAELAAAVARRLKPPPAR